MAETSDTRVVSWTIPDTRHRPVTFLLELRRTMLWNGREWWEIEREIVVGDDGAVVSKYPSERTSYPHAEVRPDPIAAIATGEMTEISPADFDRVWTLRIGDSIA